MAEDLQEAIIIKTKSPLESINCLSIPRIAPIGRTIIEKREKSIGVPH